MKAEAPETPAADGTIEWRDEEGRQLREAAGPSKEPTGVVAPNK